MNTLLITGDLAQARFSPCVPRASSLPPPNYFTCRLPSPEAPHHPSCVTRTSSLPSQFSPVTQSCPTLCDPMECITPGLPVHHQLPEFTQTHVHRVSDAIQPSHHLTLTLLLPPSIFPSIRVFSSESERCIRWPKYWSFSISLSNEYSGLISFRIDWFDLLAVQGTLKSLQHHSSKALILQCSA